RANPFHQVYVFGRWPCSRGGAEADHDIRADQRREEHDLGRKEQPQKQLAVIERQGGLVLQFDVPVMIVTVPMRVVRSVGIVGVCGIGHKELFRSTASITGDPAKPGGKLTRRAGADGPIVRRAWWRTSRLRPTGRLPE